MRTKIKRAFALLASVIASAAFGSVVAAAVDLNDEKILSVEGTVTEVHPYYSPAGDVLENESFVFMSLGLFDNGEEDIVTFHVNAETEFVNGVKPTLGAKIKAYYDGSLPVILIYPPRYNAVAIEVLSDAAGSGIYVNDVEIDAPPAFGENGIIMVPIRAICEKLGYEVRWDSDRKMVEIGNSVSLTVGKDSYNFARRAPIQLGAAPIVRDGVTYVPIDIFGNVFIDIHGSMKDGNVAIENVSVLTPAPQKAE